MKRVEPSRSLAEGWLTLQFAIKPTIKDFMAIAAQTITSAKGAQKKFIEDGIDGKTMHYREPHSRTNACTVGIYNSYWKSTGEQSTLDRNATARMMYSYTSQGTLDAILHYWGLSGTAEAFWNMLPWSFVVDYVLSIGKSLAMARTDPNVCLTEYQYCESAKYISTAGYHAALDPRLSNLVLDGKVIPCTGSGKRLLISGYEDTAYVRIPKDPFKGPALPRLKLPSNTQMANLGALVRCLF
jgi:hypothetical protein